MLYGVGLFAVSGRLDEPSSCGSESAPGAGLARTVSATSLSFRTACSEKRPTIAASAAKPNGLVFANVV